MSAFIFRISWLTLVVCLFGESVLLAQQKIDSTLFSTGKKPLTDPKAKKKGLLGTLSENFDLSNGGKALVDENGKLNKKAVLPTANIGANASAGGQSKSTDLNTTTLPDLGLKLIKDRKTRGNVNTPKKKTFNGKDYEDYAVYRQTMQLGSGDRATVSEFYVLKGDEEISKYVRDIYWFDARGNRITNAVIKETDNPQIMHGPYKKYVGDELVEEGFYYLGTKHGRWEKYSKEQDGDYALTDKTRWSKGFLADSKISYYDEAKTKIKEVIPVNYGKVSGEYWAFFDTGLMAEEGRFEDSIKIGRWREYHKFGRGGRTKKVTQYGKTKYDETEAIVLTEYDNTGKIIYDSKTAKKEEEDNN